jgi:hypothetical protein
MYSPRSFPGASAPITGLFAIKPIPRKKLNKKTQTTRTETAAPAWPSEWR